MKCVRVFSKHRIQWLCMLVCSGVMLVSSAAHAAPTADDKDNSIYTPAEESTARAADVVQPKQTNFRAHGERIAQKMMGIGETERMGSRSSAILDSIFQIPIQTLRAVNALVQTILGGRQPSNIVSVALPQAVFTPLPVPPPPSSTQHLYTVQPNLLPLDKSKLKDASITSDLA